MTGIQLSITNNGSGWKSRVLIRQANDHVWDKEDPCESLDHAAAMAIVQLQAWIENEKGLPPGGVRFDNPES